MRKWFRRSFLSFYASTVKISTRSNLADKCNISFDNAGKEIYQNSRKRCHKMVWKVNEYSQYTASFYRHQLLHSFSYSLQIRKYLTMSASRIKISPTMSCLLFPTLIALCLAVTNNSSGKTSSNQVSSFAPSSLPFSVNICL